MIARSIPLRGLPVAAAFAALAWAPRASAQAPDANAQADASFKEAMQLRAEGHEVEACPKFAESKRLAPGIGVTMYLADCYEKTGRRSSAWREFRDAERMAREKSDKRADVAAQRAKALEPTMSRLVVNAPPSAASGGASMQLDGAALPPEFWNAALAVDEGDHVLTVTPAGQPAQTVNVHVGPGPTPTATDVASILVPPPPAPAAPATPTAPAAPAASAPPAALASTPPEPAGERPGAATARWVGVGLMVAGAAGVGIGTWLVTSKVRDVMPNGQLCNAHLRDHAVPEAILAFSAGGVALVSGGILFYVNRPGRHYEMSLGPSLVPGGGGAQLQGAF